MPANDMLKRELHSSYLEGELTREIYRISCLRPCGSNLKLLYHEDSHMP
jgi:hypothetical protein